MCHCRFWKGSDCMVIVIKITVIGWSVTCERNGQRIFLSDNRMFSLKSMVITIKEIGWFSRTKLYCLYCQLAMKRCLEIDFTASSVFSMREVKLDVLLTSIFLFSLCPTWMLSHSFQCISWFLYFSTFVAMLLDFLRNVWLHNHYISGQCTLSCGIFEKHSCCNRCYWPYYKYFWYFGMPFLHISRMPRVSTLDFRNPHKDTETM